MYFYDNYYTLSEFLKLGYSFIATKVLYRKATLIRRPFFLRGKPRVEIGEGFTTGYNCRIEAFGNKDDRSKRLMIGKNCHFGDNVHVAAAERVTIGDDCLLASKIFISDSSHGNYSGVNCSSPDTDPNTRPLHTAPVSIGKRVWIGENVCILMGVSIGDGCVIGSNAVVTKSIPANSIAVGSPAKVIKQYDSKTQTWNSVI